MAGKVWFGTKAAMQWIPAPAVNISAGKQGYENTLQYLNGGSRVRRSKASAKKYSFSWNLMSRSDIQPILDYADGMYGNGPLYYSDPFAQDRNVLPAYWAAPYINYYDGPVIVDGARPELVNNGVSVNGYPVESAVYTVTSASSVPSIFVPIPPGYTAYVGAHGSLVSGSASVRVTPEISAIASGTPVDLTLLANTAAPTNATFSGNSFIGITLTLRSASTGKLQLSGLMVQVLPDGAVSPVGGFVSGQGTSGMSFTSQPAVTQYSAVMDRVGVSADLVETEAWTW